MIARVSEKYYAGSAELNTGRVFYPVIFRRQGLGAFGRVRWETRTVYEYLTARNAAEDLAAKLNAELEKAGQA